MRDFFIKSMNMKQLLIAIFALTSIFVNAQEAKLFGIVTDENNKPIFDATVIYKQDVTLGTHTDELGMYELEVPSGKTTLIFRYTGMNTDTVLLNLAENETRRVNFQMS